MHIIRLLTVDLDGTSDRPKETSETTLLIHRALNSGVLVFATGRIRNTECYRQELGWMPMVLVNGAEIWARPGELLELALSNRKGRGSPACSGPRRLVLGAVDSLVHLNEC